MFVMPDPEFYRVSGEMLCNICGLTYWKHPYDPDFLSYDGRPFLKRLCDGSLVKL